MAEISVQFKNKFNGYDKAQVEEYIRVTESKLQETLQRIINEGSGGLICILL